MLQRRWLRRLRRGRLGADHRGHGDEELAEDEVRELDALEGRRELPRRRVGEEGWMQTKNATAGQEK